MRKRKLAERLAVYRKKTSIEKDGKIETLIETGIDVPSLTTLGTFILCLLTFIGYCIKGNQSLAHLAEISFGAFLGSLPGTIRAQKHKQLEEK